MELGRETPDSTTCARLLEDGLAVIGAGFHVVRQSLAPTVFWSRQPKAASRRPCGGAGGVQRLGRPAQAGG